MTLPTHKQKQDFPRFTKLTAGDHIYYIPSGQLGSAIDTRYFKELEDKSILMWNIVTGEYSYRVGLALDAEWVEGSVPLVDLLLLMLHQKSF